MKVGILGGGQLGRMLALAGAPLGISFRCLEPASDSCAGQVCQQILGEYEDFQSLYRFCQGMDVVTYEFENVPVRSAYWLEERLKVYPPSRALSVAQDRIAEKSFFRDLGIAVPEFAAVNTREELNAAVQSIGLPAVLKTTRFGYDGKGQAVLRNEADVDTAWEKLQGRPLILEQFIDFERELSIISARGRDGECRFYTLVQNHHRDGILRQTIAPAPESTSELQSEAEQIARKALEALDYVGVLAIELFQKDNNLLVNEMAPRVHNSGHWTIEGAETSQFENHLRAILGLPLGSTHTRGQSFMFNLIGVEPDREELLSLPGVHLHWYGKKVKPNRKVGHVTLRTDLPEPMRMLLPRVRRILGE